MRPTDENQNASNRPNLMSSPRATGSEENILDMLERDAGKRRSPVVRFAWYGTAAILIFGLAGALVWLVRDNSMKRELDVMLATPTPVAPTPAEPAVAAMVVPAASEVHVHAQGAAIIDNPEASSPEVAAQPQVAAPVEEAERTLPAVAAPAAQPEPPPLVLLSPQEAAAVRGEAVAAAAKPEAINHVREAPPEPDTELLQPDMPVAKAVATRTAPVAERVATKAQVQATPRAAAGQARGSARAAAQKPKKNAPTAAPDEPIDGDVALISAIIMHATRHAAERETPPTRKTEP